MNYTTYDMGAYRIHVIPTNHFKYMTIRFDFRKKIELQDVGYLPFLMAMLLEGCKKYPSRRELELASDDLYSMRWHYRVRQSGKCFGVHFDFGFLDETYTEDGMLQKTLEMVHDILFEPDVTNGEFPKEKVEYIHHKFLENVRTFPENQVSYANFRMLQEMLPDSSICYPLYGGEEVLNNINEKTLYQYYQKFLKKYQLDIFICGNIGEVSYSQLLRKMIPINTLKHPMEEPFLYQNHFRKRSKTIIEKKEYNQSQLVIGCKVEPLTPYESQYVMPIYNYLLGGGPDSMLFHIVREKHSLCYTIHSTYQSTIGILKIVAGIEKDDFKKALRLIKQSMKKIINGGFTNEQIQNGILSYTSAYLEITDFQDSMIASLSNHLFLHTDLREEKLMNIKKVTKEEIMMVARKVHLDTIYLLEGEVTYEKDEN